MYAESAEDDRRSASLHDFQIHIEAVPPEQDTPPVRSSSRASSAREGHLSGLLTVENNGAGPSSRQRSRSIASSNASSLHSTKEKIRTIGRVALATRKMLEHDATTKVPTGVHQDLTQVLSGPSGQEQAAQVGQILDAAPRFGAPVSEEVVRAARTRIEHLMPKSIKDLETSIPQPQTGRVWRQDGFLTSDNEAVACYLRYAETRGVEFPAVLPAGLTVTIRYSAEALDHYKNFLRRSIVDNVDLGDGDVAKIKKGNIALARLLLVLENASDSKDWPAVGFLASNDVDCLSFTSNDPDFQSALDATRSAGGNDRAARDLRIRTNAAAMIGIAKSVVYNKKVGWCGGGSVTVTMGLGMLFELFLLPRWAGRKFGSESNPVWKLSKTLWKLSGMGMLTPLVCEFFDSLFIKPISEGIKGGNVIPESWADAGELVFEALMGACFSAAGALLNNYVQNVQIDNPWLRLLANFTTGEIAVMSAALIVSMTLKDEEIDQRAAIAEKLLRHCPEGVDLKAFTQKLASRVQDLLGDGITKKSYGVAGQLGAANAFLQTGINPKRGSIAAKALLILRTTAFNPIEIISFLILYASSQLLGGDKVGSKTLEKYVATTDAKQKALYSTVFDIATNEVMERGPRSAAADALAPEGSTHFPAERIDAIFHPSGIVKNLGPAKVGGFLSDGINQVARLGSLPRELVALTGLVKRPLKRRLNDYLDGQTASATTGSQHGGGGGSGAARPIKKPRLSSWLSPLGKRKAGDTEAGSGTQQPQPDAGDGPSSGVQAEREGSLRAAPFPAFAPDGGPSAKKPRNDGTPGENPGAIQMTRFDTRSSQGGAN